VSQKLLNDFDILSIRLQQHAEGVASRLEPGQPGTIVSGAIPRPTIFQ
jgi:hypothetical protein